MMISTRMSVAGLVLAAGLALSACATVPAPSAQPSAETADPFETTNDAFRALYAQNRAETLALRGHALIVQFDDLVEVRGGEERRRATFTPPVYHDLKTIAHVPLAIVVIAARSVDDADDATWKQELRDFQNQLDVLSEDVITERFDDVLQRERQIRIVSESRRYISRILPAEQVDRVGLERFARRVAPLVMANSFDAAGAQLDGLHALTEEWKEDMGEARWADLHVIVLGPKMPRVGNLQYEYFARQLGDAERGKRLIYAEGLFAPDPAITLLGTVLQDRLAAELFFDNRMRLDRDLLADDAIIHLARIFGMKPRAQE